ncbi:MAG: Pvc16 family protein [Rubrivivax sp.]|nr:Pvc16 family protein [Rubrivivax sp.]
MANYLALAAVAKTVLKMLEEACPRDEFIGTPSFVLYPGPDFTPAVSEGFSLLVWRVGVNSAIRNQPARRRPDGLKRRPSLPVDMGLLITPWSTEAERQLRLLGWLMRHIEDHAVIPAALLNQALSRRDRPAFEPDEAVELYVDTLGVPDQLGLWDKFRNRWQTSVTYAARSVMIESDITLGEGALVQTRELRAGTPGAAP